MTATAIREINKMGVAERIMLAERIWDSIPRHSEELSLSASQMRDLDRRINALEQGRCRTTTWGKVKKKLWACRKKG
jgi:putative addiction module component (TIGR02574 family)